MYVAVDPERLEDLAGRCDRAADDVDERARRIAATLQWTGQVAGAPATIRAVATDLRSDAAELRRRAGAARRAAEDDGGWSWTALWRFFSEDLADLWDGGDDSMPWGEWLAGLTTVGRTSVAVAKAVVTGTKTVAPKGLLRGALERLPGMGWMAGPAASAALRGVGIAGGLYEGARGAVEVVRHGNPVEAYRREGAGYVADVSGAAFNLSSSAFLAAPNPVTGAVVVGTGVTWVGAEAWDHREEIAQTWEAARRWTGERLDDAGAAVGSAVGEAGDVAGDLAEDAADALGDVADLASFWN